MKKGVIIILAIAIIGAISLHEKSGSITQLVSPVTTSAGLPTASSSPSSVRASSPSNLKDGTYSGQTEQTPYGPVQIAVSVSGGKISDINFLQMPSDLGHSQEVTAFSEPLLKQETLDRQSPHLDFVSGATATSEAYVMSLQAALDKAAIS